MQGLPAAGLNRQEQQLLATLAGRSSGQPQGLAAAGSGADPDADVGGTGCVVNRDSKKFFNFGQYRQQQD